VPIADILGPNRRPPIATARHEAVWRVRLATGWSLPRLGRFFKRDHTTVLHSIRKMNKRSARDPELRAYMISLSLPQDRSQSDSLNLHAFPVRPIVREPGK
jgi:chromosomal replication initiator protein